MMFTTCSIMRVKIETFVKEGWPFLLAMFAVLMLITYVPSARRLAADAADGAVTLARRRSEAAVLADGRPAAARSSA